MSRRKNVISGVSFRKPTAPSRLVEKGPGGPSSGDVFTVKGFGDNDGDLVINIAQIRQMLMNLKPQSQVLISNLKEDDSKNFHQVVNIIAVAYKTAAYATILKAIEEIFAEELSSNTATPGTVAAYFVGCHLQTTFRIPGCSAICAGAVPLDPSASNCGQCQNLVLLYNADSHIFTALNQVSSEMRVDTYIFIPSQVNFTSFNADEEEKLKQYGVSNVRLVKYEPNGVDYKALSDNFVPLANVKAVATGSASDPADPVSQTTYNIDMILVILLIVILVILVLFVVAKILMH